MATNQRNAPMSDKQALAIARMYVHLHAGIVARQRGHRDKIAIELAAVERKLRELVDQQTNKTEVTR